MINGTERATWRKSSKSASNTQCVEMHHTLTQVRDSKNATGPVLRGNMTAFVTEVKAGKYDA